MSRFARGLVVGKFAPLHLGHEFLIRTAAAACEHLVVLSYSRPELPGCEPERRERWLAARFPGLERLVVTPARVSAWQQAGLPLMDMPENDAPDEAHRRFVAQLCLQVLGGPVQVVFTSEAYGDGFAAALTRHFAETGNGPVRHVEVDRARLRVPVSGTALRADPHGLRDFLAPEVRADFAERICLLGGESTGKSTLTPVLAHALGGLAVAEYGRDYWMERGGRLVFGDMLHIAQTQVAREEAAAAATPRHVVCDTSPLTTLFYSRHLFSRADAALEALAARRYSHTFLCAPDFPFVQDGTRTGEALRQRQHAWYLDELERRHIGFTLLEGSLGARLSQALRQLR